MIDGVVTIKELVETTGAQVKVFAPVALRVTFSPAHNNELVVATVIIGSDNVETLLNEVPRAPQVLETATLIVPALFTIALIVLVSDVPVQPPGKVQVYVAFLIGSTL